MDARRARGRAERKTISSSHSSVPANSSPSASGSTAANAQSSSSARIPASTSSCVVLDHVDLDPGVSGAEIGEDAEQVVRAGRVHAADPELPRSSPESSSSSPCISSTSASTRCA